MANFVNFGRVVIDLDDVKSVKLISADPPKVAIRFKQGDWQILDEGNAANVWAYFQRSPSPPASNS